MSEQSRLVAGRFRMIRRLGAGAMASVYLAEDCELGRRVAIKRLHPESPEDIAPRFRREMRVAASLSHPNVVTLYDATMDGDVVLLIMEYVEGPTLAQRMADGPLDHAAAIATLRALADAVDYLHARGIIHRDVKPANILLDSADRVKLTDLGIASAAQATGITTVGTILGTPAYMAPELFEGERATPAADIYSIAAIAFEMLSGRRAREGGTPAVMALRATSEPPPDLREVRPDAGALAAVLERGMARDPGDRPATATALVDDIAAALHERALPATGAMAAPDRPAARAPAPAPQRTAAVEVDAAAERTPGPAARPARRPERERERRAPVGLLLGAAALVAALVVVLLVASGGDAPKRSASRSTARTTGSTPKQSTAGNTTGAAAAASPSSPAGAVRAFYGRAAADRYDAAWALAGPALRSQLGGFDGFRRTFSTLRSIVFSRAQTVNRSARAATVAIATTATHTDRVDHCTGTADTAPAPGGGWLVTHISVAC